MNNLKNIIIYLLCLSGSSICYAQSTVKTDTTQSLVAEKIEVIKAFEASLMEAEMILFRPSLPEVIPITRIYEYDLTIIPYAIEYPDPVIRPIAMKAEPPKNVVNHYAKIGYGNLKNPMAEIRLANKFSDLVDWSLSFDYDGADDSQDIPLQKYSRWYLSSSQDFNLLETERLHTVLSGGLEKRYFFYQGEDKLNSNGEEENPRDIGRFDIDLIFFNGVEKDIKLDYKVQLQNKFTSISDLDKSELNTIFKLSATKTNHENLSFTFGGGIDYNRINGQGNLFSFIKPNLVITGKKYGLNLGVNVIQGDDNLNLFPDIELTYALDKKKLQVVLGSTQNYLRNNYRNIVDYNPFASGMDSLPTTIISDVYGGVKGDLGGLIYNAKAGYKNIRNHAIYNIDFDDELRRVHTMVTDVNSVYISGTLYYPIHKWITLGANTTQNFYSGLSVEEFWSIPSLEFNAFANLNFLDHKINISPSLFLKDRANVLDSEGNNIEMDDLIDFNIELEFRPLKEASVWVKGNNIFNKTYRRWYGYENFGIHFQGGIKVIF